MNSSSDSWDWSRMLPALLPLAASTNKPASLHTKPHLPVQRRGSQRVFGTCISPMCCLTGWMFQHCICSAILFPSQLFLNFGREKNVKICVQAVSQVE